MVHVMKSAILIETNGNTLSSKRTFVAANHMLEGKQDPGPGKVKKGKPLKRDSQRKR
jgi:hypothetical protein